MFRTPQASIADWVPAVLLLTTGFNLFAWLSRQTTQIIVASVITGGVTSTLAVFQHRAFLCRTIGPAALHLTRRRILAQASWALWLFVLVAGCDVLMLWVVVRGDHRFMLRDALLTLNHGLIWVFVTMSVIVITHVALRVLALMILGHCHTTFNKMHIQIRSGETVTRNVFLCSRLSLCAVTCVAVALSVWTESPSWLLGVVLISLFSPRDFEALSLLGVSSHAAVGENEAGDLLVYFPTDAPIPKLLV